MDNYGLMSFDAAPLDDFNNMPHNVILNTPRIYDPTLPSMWVDLFTDDTCTTVEEENYYQLDVRQREPNTGFRIARTLPKV